MKKFDTATAVRERIKEICATKNYTINKLATESALNQSTLRDFMNGKNNNIGIITINKICDGLEITLYEFFNSDIFKHLEQEIK